MWQRIVTIPMRRNVSASGKTQTVWDAFNDDVGYLSGREVIRVSVSPRRGKVRLRFAEHREYCPADCPNQPVMHFKYIIRALIRKHR